MKKVILNIEGMTCSACSNGLEKYLNKQNGVINAEVNLVMATALVEYDENKLSIKDLNRFVKESGFKSLGEKKPESKNKGAISLIVFSILGLLLMYISMGQMWGAKVFQFVDINKNPENYILVLMFISFLFLIYGFDIIKNGIKNIFHKMPNMDSLVGIGVIVNFAYSFYNAIEFFINSSNYAMHMSNMVNMADVANMSNMAINSPINNLYFESSAIIILFVKLGRFIDKRNKAKAVDSIKNLVTITPKDAKILKNGKEEVVTIDKIQKGDIVVSKPGERISVDGEITNGKTHTDESFITGESKPIAKKVGDKVIAGSINYDGAIEYKAEKIGKDSSISNIVKMVVEATNTKAPIQAVADKISGYFVPTIFIISILAFILNFIVKQNMNDAILALVSVLVVACPCALGLATPLAMVCAIGNASKRGILVKSSEAMENLNKIDTVVFDKTGTLTEGKLTVTGGKYSTETIKILQSLEKNSNHPLAKGICEFKYENFESSKIENSKAENIENYNEKNSSGLKPVEEFKEISGLGVQGIIEGRKYYAGNAKFIDYVNNHDKNVENQEFKNNGQILNPYKEEEQRLAEDGQSIVYLFDDEKVLAICGLADKIKAGINEELNKIRDLGKEIIMLTGDNSKTAEVIGKKLGLGKENIISNVSPEEKLGEIKTLLETKKVLMVGDGINDSPSLKAATVGISVANGTDISADSADIVFLNNNPDNIYQVLTLGKKSMKIIKQNLFWALFYNICMIPLATGLIPAKIGELVLSMHSQNLTINPMIASLAMTLSSFTVVVNSLRLLKK